LPFFFELFHKVFVLDPLATLDLGTSDLHVAKDFDVIKNLVIGNVVVQVLEHAQNSLLSCHDGYLSYACPQ
jgi:hypothetical protein